MGDNRRFGNHSMQGHIKLGILLSPSVSCLFLLIKPYLSKNKKKKIASEMPIPHSPGEGIDAGVA